MAETPTPYAAGKPEKCLKCGSRKSMELFGGGKYWASKYECGTVLGHDDPDMLAIDEGKCCLQRQLAALRTESDMRLLALSLAVHEDDGVFHKDAWLLCCIEQAESAVEEPCDGTE